MRSNASAASEYLDFIRGRGLSDSTRKRYRYYLGRFLSWLGDVDFREVDARLLQSYREYVGTLVSLRGQPLKAQSIESQMTTVRELFRYLYRTGSILTNPFENLPDQVLPGKDERAIFSEQDIARFLDCIDTGGPEGQRDRAFFELIYSSGLRNQEARLLQMNDVNLADRVIRVTGKGNKDRYVPICVVASKYLTAYLNAGRKVLQQSVSDQGRRFVFLSRASGQVSWKVMRTRFMVYLDQAGLTHKGYTIHSIRHATATHLLAHGASIRYVQELLGHESIKTTQLYTRPGVENIKAVYRTYHPRENAFWREPDDAYREALLQLVDEREVNAETHKRKQERKH